MKIYPASEYFLDKKTIEDGIAKIKKELEKSEKKFREEFNTEEANNLKNTVGEFLTNMDINPYSVAIDSYVNYFCENLVSLMDYFDEPIFFIDEPARVEEQLRVVETEFKESMSHRLLKGYVLSGQTDILWDKNYILNRINDQQKVLFTTIAQKVKGFNVEEFVDVDARTSAHITASLKCLWRT